MTFSDNEAVEGEIHEAERLYVSTRGLHVCFKTRAQAERAYASAVAVGRRSILEGTQVIEPQSLPSREDSEVQ